MIRAQFYTTVSFENLFFQPQVFQSNALPTIQKGTFTFIEQFIIVLLTD